MTSAIALSLASVSVLKADICTDPQTAVEYDSSNANGDTPDETPDWSLTCPGHDGDTNLDSIIDGVLVVDDTSDTTKAKYCAENLFDDSCDPVQDAVYEFSCRAVSMDVNAPTWVNNGAEFVFGCGMSTGDDSALDYDFGVTVSLNEGVGFWKVVDGNASWLEVDGDQQRAPIDQDPVTEEWKDCHLFRIELHSRPFARKVKLFVDNEATPTLEFDIDELADNNLDDLTILASTSQKGKSKFELTHFRYRIGATSFDNGSPDCAADINEDGEVDTTDLLLLLAAWGPCTGCDEDIDDDDVVGISDLLILLATWGSCP